jgi:hypothetical protein
LTIEEELELCEDGRDEEEIGFVGKEDGGEGLVRMEVLRLVGGNEL